MSVRSLERRLHRNQAHMTIIGTLKGSNGKTCSEEGHMANYSVQLTPPMLQHPNGKGLKLPVHFRAVNGVEWQ
jgi:hypothetical protein